MLNIVEEEDMNIASLSLASFVAEDREKSSVLGGLKALDVKKKPSMDGADTIVMSPGTSPVKKPESGEI
jgi:hypothetical protein